MIGIFGVALLCTRGSPVSGRSCVESGFIALGLQVQVVWSPSLGDWELRLCTFVFKGLPPESVLS